MLLSRLIALRASARPEHRNVQSGNRNKRRSACRWCNATPLDVSWQKEGTEAVVAWLKVLFPRTSITKVIHLFRCVGRFSRLAGA
jgi:hypothetical protein